MDSIKSSLSDSAVYSLGHTQADTQAAILTGFQISTPCYWFCGWVSVALPC